MTELQRAVLLLQFFVQTVGRRKCLEEACGWGDYGKDNELLATTKRFLAKPEIEKVCNEIKVILDETLPER